MATRSPVKFELPAALQEFFVIKSNSNVNSPEVVHLNTTDVARWNNAPRSDWAEMGDREHFVQFYEADGFLLSSLSGFIGKAINSGDGAVVVATRAHRNGLDELLQANGLDLAKEASNGRFSFLPSLDGVKVLLVDDDPDTLQILSVMLGESKAIVETANSVSVALEVLEWYQPDVLVSDLAMPCEDGYSLIGKIRALGRGIGSEKLLGARHAVPPPQ